MIAFGRLSSHSHAVDSSLKSLRSNPITFRSARSSLVHGLNLKNHSSFPSYASLSLPSRFYTSSPKIGTFEKSSANEIQSIEKESGNILNHPGNSLKQRASFFFHEASVFGQQFFSGSKQLFQNMVMTSNLRMRKKKGEKLNWRQEMIIRQTISDLKKLTPFMILQILPASMIWIVALTMVFPNFLPSIYRTYYINVCFFTFQPLFHPILPQLAKTNFYQSLINQLATKNREKGSLDLVQIFRKELENQHLVQQSQIMSNLISMIDRREFVPAREILKLDNTQFETMFDVMDLPHEAKFAVCSLFGLSSKSWFPTIVLTYQLNKHIKTIMEDDQMLLALDISELNDEELRDICAKRALQYIETISRDQLLVQIQAWLSLSKNPETCPALFILFSTVNARAILAVDTNIEMASNSNSPQPS